MKTAMVVLPTWINGELRISKIMRGKFGQMGRQNVTVITQLKDKFFEIAKLSLF